MRLHLPLIFVLLTTITGSSFAYNGYYSQRYESRENPVNTIQSALDKLKTFSANSDSVNPILLRSFIENEIIPHFDFDRMTWWIAGPYARQMSDSELDDLEERVEQTFLSSLARHMGDFDASTSQVSFRPAQMRGPDEANVVAIVYRQTMRPARLEFRMKGYGSDWKIIDVKANGTSAVLYYRKHFMSRLRQPR